MFDQIQNISHEPNALEFLNDFTSVLEHAEYPEKHMIHRQGSLCNKLFIIHKGLARVFYYKDGKDITAHFAAENATITAIDSFIQNKKSKYNIETLEPISLSWITRQNWLDLVNKHPEYEKFARLFLEEIYVDLAERLEDLLFHSAKERYWKLVKKHPMLLQRVNLGHIASYLGITQETLSRIRAEN